jgi:hypothetical protein
METEKASLTINDLQMVLSVIDTCSKRGAFKPQEFEAVGKLFNHLTLFVKQNLPPDESNSETETIEESSTEDSQVNTSDNKSV